MAESSRKLSNVACIKCFGCGEELVIDKKPLRTEYECCCCGSLMTAKFFKNGKVNLRIEKRGDEKNGK